MPNKDKSKHMIMTKKYKQRHIKTDGRLLICWLFINALLLDLFNYHFIRTLILKLPFVQIISHNHWSITQQKFENQQNKYQIMKAI